jgi:isoleucyl-tRNA synthetase
MPFDFRKIEEKITNFWEANQVFEQSIKLRKGSKKFVFFEGPPTANGKPGIHHFEARAFKDVICRLKAMQGFQVLRKAGWDTHGLPVEIEVEKELGFKNKKDIENYGIAEFNKKAKESVWKYKKEWETMTKRMGYWVDMENPYITYEWKYMESLWAIIKKIWDKKLLYLAHRVVPFCVRCGTPLSSHEVAQGYKVVKERSVYLKFKLKNLPSKIGNWKLEIGNSPLYILAWTTTPWTLPGNVALAVGKDIDYIVAEKDNENYIVAKELADKVVGVGYKKIKDLRGKDLVGMEYEPLFDVKELRSEKSYKVYEAGFVSTADGTGVVHTAVMYGEDDYNLGTKVGLPKFHTVTESGKFINVEPGLDGRYVKDAETESIIVEGLKAKGLLLKEEEYEHDYPFCWRCGKPLLYYAKESWFIKMSAVKAQIQKNNSKINWVPEHIKNGRFGQWLKEGKDWAFSRERYWGTPLPIWKCVKCGSFKVAGSLEDLEKNKFEKTKSKNYPYNDVGEIDLHRPYVDKILLKCTECKSEMKKVPDLIDVWFDSGAMPYAQWHWPFENEKIFKEQFPAHYISEGVDQTRGWFYTLLAISTLLGKGPAYKNVISLGHVLDEKGQKMSKSKGNTVSPNEVMDKFGTDTIRWYFYTINSPGESKLFATKDIALKYNGFISTLDNCTRFYELYGENKKYKYQNANLSLLDKWMLSKLNRLIKEMTEQMDNYDVVTAARAIEKFVMEDFSNWWLRRSRKRKESLELLRYIMLEIAKLTAPFIPFISEDIHTRLYRQNKKGKDTISVHLQSWPKADMKLINDNLEKEMEEARAVVALGLAKRKEAQIKVRQPLASIKTKRVKSFAEGVEELIKEELNIKVVLYDAKLSEQAVLDTKLTEELIREGYVRELMRQIQDMRKEAGYRLNEYVYCEWESGDQDISDTVRKWSDEIKKETLLSEMLNMPAEKKGFDIEKEFELSPSKKISIRLRSLGSEK